MALFDASKSIGIFLGLTEGSLEYGAELTLKYDREYQSQPMLGQFVLVELERSDEAILGRITAVSSQGTLASPMGEEYGARAIKNQRLISEDIKQQFLRYTCSVRLLGLLKQKGDRVIFTPSHLSLIHI